MSDMKVADEVEMLRQSTRAVRFANALRQLRLGPVDVKHDRVLVFAGKSAPLTFAVLSGGNGRPSEVERALADAERFDVAAIPVVVSRHFTPGAEELLRARGANFMDDARLRVLVADPPLFVDRATPTELPVEMPSRPALRGASGLVALALLNKSGLSWSVTELAAAARCSVGTVHKVLVRLEHEGLLASGGTGPARRRTLTEPERLLDLWAEEARADRRVVARAYVYAGGQGDPRGLAIGVSCALIGRRIDHAVTGASAALFLAPHITAVPECEVWVGPDTSPHAAIDAMQGRAVQRGANVVVLQGRDDTPLSGSAAASTFRDTRGSSEVCVAHPLRVYSDLLADPARGAEQAEVLREQVIRL